MASAAKGYTSLLMATHKNYIDIVKLLVNQDADIMRNIGNWQLSFIAACENKNWDIAEYFLNNFKYEGKREKKHINFILEEGLGIIKELEDDSDKYKIVKRLIENKLNEY